MTIITVKHSAGVIPVELYAVLSQQLTDTVLQIECGKISDAAREGFQVHYQELPSGAAFQAGKLTEQILIIDICTMAGDWPISRKSELIKSVYSQLIEVLNTDVQRGWWVTFREMSEGSWGLMGYAASMLDFLSADIFSPGRAEAIRNALGKEQS